MTTLEKFLVALSVAFTLSVIGLVWAGIVALLRIGNG